MLPPLGKIDEEAGEFWVPNPFLMSNLGKNLSAYERNRLYLNLKGVGFLDASFASDADLASDSRSVVPADFNNDGAPDLLVGSVGGGPLRLFLNRFPQKNRVHLRLIGTNSNRSAVGTRVVLHLGKQKIVRDLFLHNTFMSQAPAELRIGVGDAQTIDKMIIRWPTGNAQTFEQVPSNLTLTVKEGTDKYQLKAG
ncbi:MAG: CRTAC1 family protein [Gemmataceae bacterium]